MLTVLKSSTSETYSYDQVGNRTAKTNRLATLPAGDQPTSNFAYDAIYQLTQVTQAPATTENYSYDGVGNRLSSLGTPYGYNVSNEMTAAGNATFTYDANGNTTSKTDSSGSTAYTWDFENRLTSVTLPNGHVQNYKYDPFGRRVFKDSPTKKRVFVYDGDNVTERLDAAGKVTVRFTQGLGIDEPLATSQSGVVDYYEADGLGSITSLTSASGNIANSYEYDSFGHLTGSNETVSNAFRYTGREDDGETKLYYYRARYYDPSTGRFLSEDPIRMGGGVDFYAYVRNNPVVRNDPTGLIHQAWTERPYDGRLHDDTTGLEVLCTNPKTLARDIAWLEHSISVREAEIDGLGQNAAIGHIDRLDAEKETLMHCRECRDRDKKPAPIGDPTWEAVKDSVRKLGNEIIDYCALHPVTCVGIGLGATSILSPIPPILLPE